MFASQQVGGLDSHFLFFFSLRKGKEGGVVVVVGVAVAIVIVIVIAAAAAAAAAASAWLRQREPSLLLRFISF